MFEKRGVNLSAKQFTTSGTGLVFDYPEFFSNVKRANPSDGRGRSDNSQRLNQIKATAKVGRNKGAAHLCSGGDDSSASGDSSLPIFREQIHTKLCMDGGFSVLPHAKIPPTFPSTNDCGV